MTKLKIKIDNRIAFNGTLGEWKSRPPTEFKDAVAQGAAPQPWMKAILIAAADAVMHEQSVSIHARTRLKGVRSGWSVEVVLT